MKSFLMRYRYYLGGSIAVLLALGGYWWYSRQRAFDAWYLMPNNPVLILESSDILAAYQDIQSKPVWKNLQATIYFGTIAERMQSLARLLAKEGGMRNVLAGKRVTASLHLTGKEDFDALFYIPIQNEKDKIVLDKIISIFKKNPEYQFFQRNYRGYQIHEVAHTDLLGRFSYFAYRGHWIASYAPFLIEDVIRKIDSGGTVFHFPQQAQLDALSQPLALQYKHLSVYLNPPRFAEWLSMTLNENLGAYFKPLGKFAQSTYLNLQNLQNKINFKGYSLTHIKDSTAWLNIFQNQEPQAFSLKNYIPNNTAVMYHFTYSDAPQFFQRWEAYQKKDNVSKTALLGLSQTKWYEGLEKELAYCLLEPADATQADKLLFLRTQNVVEFSKKLSKYSTVLASQKGIVDFKENFGKNTIQEIPLADVPQILLGDLVAGFKQVFYTVVGQYIVFANSSRVLKDYLENHRNDQVWGKNKSLKPLLEELDTPQNINFVLQTTQAWELLYENASTKWQSLLNMYETPLKSFGWVASSFKAEKGYFNTQFTIKFESATLIAPTQLQEGYTTLTNNNFGDLVYTQPFVVRNHQDDTREILLQDFKNNLFLLSEKGRLLWKRNMGAPMRSKPQQIDIYGNDRLQYLFINMNRIHLIDRIGRNVPGFPVIVADSSSTLHTLACLDFDNNRKYHFLTSDERGRLFMLNQKFQWVSGWRPKRLDYRLATAAQTVKVQEKDYILTLQENGVLHIFAMDGKEITGFPVDLGQRFSNPIHIEVGTGLAESVLTLLSDEGKLTSVNLKGKILREQQLYRPSGKAKFWLLTDKQGKERILAVSTGGYLQVMNPNGQKLFEDTFSHKSDRWDMQYFDLGRDVQIIAATNKIDSKTYLYDLRGREIGEPIQSNCPIDLRYEPETRQLLIYRTYANQVGTLGLKLE
jgi:hypothetical protein